MEKKIQKTSVQSIISIASIAVMTAIIAVCSWITVPFTVPFTMQTFAVFFAVRFSGGKKGTASVLLYILMGVIGLPVFSGFSSGLAIITGPTGGYIIGFIFIALLYLVCEKKITNEIKAYAVLIAGLILCYAFGTVQFIFVTNAGGSSYGITEALSLCVFPFIIPDIAKIALAELIATRTRKAIKFID